MIIERMAAELDLSVSFLQSLANGASHEYKTYTIPKRTGGFRTIHHPSRRLKVAQRWLTSRVIASLPVHEAAMAYRQGRSVLDNANAHASSRFLLRMDLFAFFESIRESDVQAFIAQNSVLFQGWVPSDTDFFCKLVCRKGALTVGAPTSPGLSNAICYDMDTMLTVLGAKSAVTYTRYADDLFFSATQPNILRDFQSRVEAVLDSMPFPGHLKVNVQKTRHSSRRRKRRVTGIVLGSDGRAYVGRDVKRRIRALIFKYDSLNHRTRSTLAGLIAYAIGIEPSFLNSLIKKYGLANVREAMTIKERKAEA